MTYVPGGGAAMSSEIALLNWSGGGGSSYKPTTAYDLKEEVLKLSLDQKIELAKIILNSIK